MENLSTRGARNSVANACDIDRMAPFGLEVRDRNLYIVGLSDELKHDEYVPVMFRRIKCHSSGGQYRKKGWISPYYSRTEMSVDGKVAYSRSLRSQSATEAGVPLSYDAGLWLYITAKGNVSWGSRGIRIRKGGVSRSVSLQMGIAFCRRNERNSGYQLKDAVTPVVPFFLRYSLNSENTYRFALTK